MILFHAPARNEDVFIALAFGLLAAHALGLGACANAALLYAMLEPLKLMQGAEVCGDHTSRLAWTETAKTMPFGAIWDLFCESEDVPLDTDWLKDVKTYEANVLSKR